MSSLCPTLHTTEQYQQFRKAVLSPFQGSLETKEMSGGYKFALFWVALFMVLLPLVYVAMVVGFCLFEYFYFAWTFEAFKAELDRNQGKGVFFLIVLYFSVPLGIGTLILILVKPLLFGWGGKDTRFEISREREPLLYEFVEHLCRYVGAPMPKRIFVDCDVNASAGFTYGLRGAIFGGNDCDLTIGLPLVAGMNVSEFGGVLAHEFGHFTQSGARRMEYIINRVLFWFRHIYYYRDRMDGFLTAASGAGHIFTMSVAWCVRAIVWAGRRFIWAIMMLGNLVSMFMSRQMEYDADSFQTRVIGNDGVGKVMKRLIMLSIANSKTISDLNYMIQEERLADNYPLLIAANMKILDEDLDRMATKYIRESKTGFADTHPCESDRIAVAEAVPTPGVLHVDAPASLFFRNFLGLCREVSIHFYRVDQELEIDSKAFKNVGTVIDQLLREDIGQKAITNFYQRAYLQGRFLPLNQPDKSRDLRSAAFRVKQARMKQDALRSDVAAAVEEYGKAETKVRQAEYAKELVRLGIRPNFSEFGFSFRKIGEADRVIAKFEEQRLISTSRLYNRDAAAAERFFGCRELLAYDEVRQRIEDGETLHRRMEELFPILAKYAEIQDEFDQASRRFEIINAWGGTLGGLPGDKAQQLFSSIVEETDLYRRITQQYRMNFDNFAYPFEHGVSGSTLGQFLVPHYPVTTENPLEYLDVFGNMAGRLLTTYHLMLGECLAIALAVEDVLGLPRLFVPPPEEEAEGDAGG